MNVQDAVSSRFLFGKDVELPEDKWKIGARTLEKTMRAGNGVSKTCFEKMIYEKHRTNDCFLFL